MKILRSLGLTALAVFFGWAAGSARGQSVQQRITFDLIATDAHIVRTNGISADQTNYQAVLHNIFLSKNNLVKAIALDLEGGPAWTNWADSALLRRVNLATGAEAMYLKHGNVETNVSSFFSMNNFLGGYTNVPTELTLISNQATNFLAPITSYSGLITNIGGTNVGTNYHNSASLMYFSVTTSNLCINLVGASQGDFGNGVVDQFQGASNDFLFPHETFRVVGAVYVNIRTNSFLSHGVINPEDSVFVSGPASGTFTVHAATASDIDAP